MKKLIRHIIKEETDQVVGENSRQDKIRSMIENVGILNTIKSIGGFDNFKRFVGKDFLTFDDKIVLISEIAEEYGDRNGNLIFVDHNLDIILEKEETYADGGFVATHLYYVDNVDQYYYYTYEYDNEGFVYDYPTNEGDGKTEDLDEHIIDSIVGTLAHKFL
jgi:hypothetical protein